MATYDAQRRKGVPARYIRLAAWASAPLYLALVAALAADNYRREAAILRRGIYTDTFSPTLFLELLTQPGSWFVEPDLPTYPFTDPFSVDAYMDVLSIRTRALVEVV